MTTGYNSNPSSATESHCYLSNFSLLALVAFSERKTQYRQHPIDMLTRVLQIIEGGRLIREMTKAWPCFKPYFVMCPVPLSYPVLCLQSLPLSTATAGNPKQESP